MPAPSPAQRAKYANRAVILAVISAIGAVFLGGGILIGVPPATYINVAIFLVVIIPTLALGIIGLGSTSRKEAKIALILAAIASIFFTYFAISGFRDTPAKLTLIQIEKAVQSVCSGQSIPGTAKYVPGAGRHPMVAYNASESSPVSFKWIPRELWPTALDEVELILCIRDEYSEKKGVCPYSGGTNKVRYQLKRDASLVSINSGETITLTTIAGSMPKECPSSISQGNASAIKGSKPSTGEVEDWLELVFAQ